MGNDAETDREATGDGVPAKVEIVNRSISRALRITQLRDGQELELGIVPHTGGRDEAKWTRTMPVGAKLGVEDHDSHAFIEQITVPPKVVKAVPTAVDSGQHVFTRVGDRRWENGSGDPFDMQHITQYGIILKRRGSDAVFTLPIAAGRPFWLDDGMECKTTEIVGGLVTIEIDPPNVRVGDQRPPAKRLPNVDPVLSSYDPRGTFADNIKTGCKDRIFEGLTDDSRNYTIVDDDYIVQNGIAFNTTNTLQGGKDSRVITTMHEYLEAFSVGVSVEAGAPKVPVGGGLSFQYSEATGETRTSTNGYSFAWSQKSSYSLTLHPERLKLTRAFIDAVKTTLDDADRPVPDMSGYLRDIRALQERIDALRGKKPSKTQNNVAEIREIRRKINELEAQREQLVQEVINSRLGEFIEDYGAHYAREIIFGQAAYETIRFSSEELKRMHEIGVKVGVQAKGNIKGVDVEGSVDVGYSRSDKFQQLIQDERVKQSEIGGDDMGSAEPIKIDLRPLSNLITKDHFGSALSDEDLARFRDLLDTAVETLMSEPDLYPVLQSLEIWHVHFKDFAVAPYKDPPRQIYGGIKVTRSPQPLQAPEPDGIDAPKNVSGKGRYLWNRSDKPNVRIVMKHHEPVLAGAADVYLIAEGPGDNPSVTVTADLRDYGRSNEMVTGNAVDLDLTRLRVDGDGTRTMWFNQTLLIYEVRKTAWINLPDYKRLEIARRLRDTTD